MKIFLLSFVILIIYKMLKAKFRFRILKEDIEYRLFKIEEEIIKDFDNPLLFARRGSMYQMIQDFPNANNDFSRALYLLNNGMKPRFKGREIKVKDFKKSLLKNIEYTKKPYPWFKGGIKDLSSSWFVYFIIGGFGYERQSF